MIKTVFWAFLFSFLDRFSILVRPERKRFMYWRSTQLMLAPVCCQVSRAKQDCCFSPIFFGFVLRTLVSRATVIIIITNNYCFAYGKWKRNYVSLLMFTGEKKSSVFSFLVMVFLGIPRISPQLHKTFLIVITITLLIVITVFCISVSCQEPAFAKLCREFGVLDIVVVVAFLSYLRTHFCVTAE